VRNPSVTVQLLKFLKSSFSGGSSLCNQTDILSIHTLHEGVHIYHIGQRKLCRVLHHKQDSQTNHYPLTVSTTGDTIVGGSNSGKVCVWQARTGELLQVLDHGGSKRLNSLFQFETYISGSGNLIQAVVVNCLLPHTCTVYLNPWATGLSRLGKMDCCRLSGIQ
jgi:WD40 repeat protein